MKPYDVLLARFRLLDDEHLENWRWHYEHDTKLFAGPGSDCALISMNGHG